MRGAVIHAPEDVRFETLEDPKILHPTDAVVRTAATCVCGSDLWPYRGADETNGPRPIGHEYIGFVEEVGSEVTAVRPGQFVVGSFATSDNTCPNCRRGFQSNCLNREFMSGCQAEYIRIPNAQGTLVATQEPPGEEYWPGLLAVSDVMGTGWWAADAAEVRPGTTAVVVGDGAVGLCAVIAAKEMGAERIVAMSRHAPRQELARSFGATDIVTERGDEGVARIKELTDGTGADSVLECVGTAEAMGQALRSARPGGTVGFVGVPHGVAVDGQELFSSHVGLRGGPAPVRRYLPDLVDRVLRGRIDPGRVFDLTLPLEQVAEAYKAMDERRAIKVFLKP
ncbi:zinc-dependent alcohol dehydrogenase family protein [Streptomyces beihaiensis]|uniref:Zinc-dependent alcohol dehydrogenase family protein n=1 Tax=Streptomyces beihaiensis TaxID=2984495 RepID=A0ABT3U370_9ACTN|nr:zinc-dependent alcohol dehydrogenase family protein [Streptomyces beihaiensis]MCX3062653.1 zinc-dependent alcohol dehydrogenase family protein [Streptomyces beihaiensis]